MARALNTRERTSGSVPSSARLGRRTPAAGDFAISGIGDDKAPRRGDETTLRCASVRGEGERCHDVARAGAVTCGGGVCFFLRVSMRLCVKSASLAYVEILVQKSWCNRPIESLSQLLSLNLKLLIPQ